MNRIKWFVPRDLRDVRNDVVCLMYERGYPKSHTNNRADIKELNRRIGFMNDIMFNGKPGRRPKRTDDDYMVQYEIVTTLLAGLISRFDLDVEWGDKSAGQSNSYGKFDPDR